MDSCVTRLIFGGAISSMFPLRFQDVSEIREVPDHQEVFVDPHRDESLIFELLELKSDVDDSRAAAWFLQDLAREQDAERGMVVEYSGAIGDCFDATEAADLCGRDLPKVATVAIAQMAISKARQGREAENIVKVYLANLRLRGVETDVLVTAYEPILINPRSLTAQAVGAGLAVPPAVAGCLPMLEVFRAAVLSFRISDQSLFTSMV